jgi:uncharacterized zinc-type alcohol dehydrogenase-like protein
MKVGDGDKIGIIGIGGLGHVAVKLAKAMGATVIAFTTSEWKIKDIKDNLGADDVVLYTDESQRNKYLGKLDFIIDTVPVKHDINLFINCLKVSGTMCVVGVFDTMNFDSEYLLLANRTLKGSLVSGIEETQEMLEFCAKHNISADVEIIGVDKIQSTHDKFVKKEIKYRYVIDMSSI